MLFDEFSEQVSKADKLLGYSIKELCLDDKNNELNQTEYTQPALFVVNALSYQKQIKETGNKPDFVAGHSLGEYNALQAAGALSFEAGLKLVKKRGELMSQADKGAMAAILSMTDEEIQQCLKKHDLTGIDIASYNSPSQIVISGLQEEVNRAQACFIEAGGLFIPLKASGAFHSRYMALAKDEFEKYITKFTFADLEIPVIGNVHAKPYQQGAIVQNLVDQITHTVRWTESMQYLLQQGKMEFEELGVGDVLMKLVKTIQVNFTATAPPATMGVASSGAEKSNGLEEAGPSTEALEGEGPRPYEAQEFEIGPPSLDTAPHKMEELEKKTTEPSATHPMETSQQPEASLDTKKAPEEATEAERTAERNREIEALHQRIAAWNKTYPIGTRMVVKGFDEELTTRTKALVLFGHRAAIYMKDYNGYFALDEANPAGESRSSMRV